ncbi:hypothetical protein N7300_15635 [Aeromonas caviae]|nr:MULTISPECIES: hypothetical protein [Aeromonas]MDH0352174.1 hypothetical protein [Aeromonas caviae]
MLRGRWSPDPVYPLLPR